MASLNDFNVYDTGLKVDGVNTNIVLDVGSLNHDNQNYTSALLNNSESDCNKQENRHVITSAKTAEHNQNSTDIGIAECMDHTQKKVDNTDKQHVHIKQQTYTLPIINNVNVDESGTHVSMLQEKYIDYTCDQTYSHYFVISTFMETISLWMLDIVKMIVRVLLMGVIITLLVWCMQHNKFIANCDNMDSSNTYDRYSNMVNDENENLRNMNSHQTCQAFTTHRPKKPKLLRMKCQVTKQSYVRVLPRNHTYTQFDQRSFITKDFYATQ